MAAPPIGRAAQAARIRQLLAGQTPVLVIGVAGGGKTTLLRHLASAYSGQVWQVIPAGDVPFAGLSSLLVASGASNREVAAALFLFSEDRRSDAHSDIPAAGRSLAYPIGHSDEARGPLIPARR